MKPESKEEEKKMVEEKEVRIENEDKQELVGQAKQI